jgi:hypothetical protein
VRSIEGEKADSWLDIEKTSVPDIQPAIAYLIGITSSKAMDKFRDELAEKMWADYQRHLSGREL